MTKSLSLVAAMALALAGAPGASWAGNSTPDPAHVAAASEGFLQYHPDLKWRKEGLGLYEDGKLELALKALKRSSRFADKGSQALVAEMYWKGEGTEADRSVAYAWMDLAAERGYKDFLAVREHYWSELTPKEQERALNIGRGIYAEYGDDVAKPRLEKKINQGRRGTTGSRTGYKGALSVLLPGNGTWIRLDAEQYYSDKFWQPERYFEWQDQLWQEPYRGRVEVGAVTTEESESPKME